jgi:hypothetical protein
MRGREAGCYVVDQEDSATLELIKVFCAVPQRKRVAGADAGVIPWIQREDDGLQTIQVEQRDADPAVGEQRPDVGERRLGDLHGRFDAQNHVVDLFQDLEALGRAQR